MRQGSRKFEKKNRGGPMIEFWLDLNIPKFYLGLIGKSPLEAPVGMRGMAEEDSHYLVPGQLEAVKYLLECGANVHTKDRFSTTPYLEAITNK